MNERTRVETLSVEVDADTLDKVRGAIAAGRAPPLRNLIENALASYAAASDPEAVSYLAAAYAEGLADLEAHGSEPFNADDVEAIIREGRASLNSSAGQPE